MSYAAFSQGTLIEGRVEAGETSSPLYNAHVQLNKHTRIVDSRSKEISAITGNDGYFAFKDIEAGAYNISVSVIGYQTYKDSLYLYPGQELSLDIYLDQKVVDLGEVTVSSLKMKKKVRESIIPLSVMTARELEARPALTLSDALSSQPGISLVRDGAWATSLKIRGLGEKRLVLLVDGNRVETATDIAAAMSMISLENLERVEVIKGAASTLYGSGAMGGVVNIITGRGHFSEKTYFRGKTYGGYHTVNQMYKTGAFIRSGGSKWFLNVGASIREARDMKTPEGILPNSQFSDNFIDISLGYKPKVNHEFEFDYQRFSAHDVGIPGGEAFPENAIATYPIEQRDMFSASYLVKNISGSFQELAIKYYNQYILRDVLLQPAPHIAITPTGKHYTRGINLATEWKIGQRHKILAGIDAWQRSLETNREKSIVKTVQDSMGNVISQQNILRVETPIPESIFKNGGIYIQDDFELLKDKLHVSAGARFDMINVQNELAMDPVSLTINGEMMDPVPNQRVTFGARDIYDFSWSTNIGIKHEISRVWDVNYSFGRAFRAPALEERFKYIDLGAKVRVGDPDLEPESGYFVNLGSRLWLPRLNVSVDGFMNKMDNLIVEKPGEYVYATTANPLQFDTLPALVNANVNEALLYGFEMSFQYNFYRNFVFMASSAYVRGLDTGNDTNLPQMPPLKNRLLFRYNLPGILQVDLAANLVAKQDRIADGEEMTKGYETFDIQVNSREIKMGKIAIQLRGGITNLLNEAYVNHLSSTRGFLKYEPGRNFYTKLTLNW
jgi:hemoglobin/transferrin/lactoferrin receptor protein